MAWERVGLSLATSIAAQWKSAKLPLSVMSAAKPPQFKSEVHNDARFQLSGGFGGNYKTSRNITDTDQYISLHLLSLFCKLVCFILPLCKAANIIPILFWVPSWQKATFLTLIEFVNYALCIMQIRFLNADIRLPFLVCFPSRVRTGRASDEQGRIHGYLSRV